MEKAGGMFHSEGMQQKGREKREGGGYGEDSTSSGGYGGRSNDNY